MIEMAAALYAEAAPFIRALGLVPETRRNLPNADGSPPAGSLPFPVYASPTHRLIVTGTGSLNAAIAVAFLLGRGFGAAPGREQAASILVQIGSCAAPASVPVGSLFLCNKITDAATGRPLYPDMLYRSPFAEAAVRTFAAVQGADYAGNAPAAVRADSTQIELPRQPELADMEAYGGFLAAAAFLPPHRIFTFKAVSDHGCGIQQAGSRRLTAADLTALLEPHVDPILAWLGQVQQAARAEEAEGATGSRAADPAALPFTFSATTRHRLDQLLRYAFLNGIEVQELFEAAARLEIRPAQKKAEGKRFLHELEQRILL